MLLFLFYINLFTIYIQMNSYSHNNVFVIYLPITETWNTSKGLSVSVTRGVGLRAAVWRQKIQDVSTIDSFQSFIQDKGSGYPPGTSGSYFPARN